MGGCAHVGVPLDLTNPATLAFQVRHGLLPAKAAGFNAISYDNYVLTNDFLACGAYKGANGSWVQIYSDSDPKHDPQYTHDVLNWSRRAVSATHAAGLLAIPNFEGFDEQASIVGNIFDGILAEAGGWTFWDPAPNSTSTKHPPLKTSPKQFESQVLFVRQLQRAGKGYYSIIEWGAGPDYGLNPSQYPYNISGPTNRAIRQFVVAAFMMANGDSSAIFLSCIQCYSGASGGLGNFSIWPEYAAPVGTPVGEPVKCRSTGVWSREYSGGLALVNPEARQRVVNLPAGVQWMDVYGERVAKPEAVVLEPASGLVLLKVASQAIRQEGDGNEFRELI